MVTHFKPLSTSAFQSPRSLSKVMPAGKNISIPGETANNGCAAQIASMGADAKLVTR